MPIDPQLENYLSRLDRALGQIAVSERSDIITEIKSHVLSAQEKNPAETLGQILASLGEPETVANRYLMERGLKPAPAPKTPMVKWLTIGFLGTLTLGVTLILVLIFKFTPLISVDEEKGRVQLLGGLIDVNEKMMSNMKIDGEVRFGDGSRHIEGEQKLRPGTKEINVRFTNGKLDVKPSRSDSVHWDCKLSGGDDAKIESKGSQFILDLSSNLGAKCDLLVPKIQGKLVISGINGKLELDRPQNATNVSLSNGKINVRPDRSLEYRYDNHVRVGKIDSFPSSSNPRALPIAIQVGNGKISLEN